MVWLLLTAIGLLVVVGLNRRRPFAFVLWFPVAATAAVLAVLATNGIPKPQEGPGGLVGLAYIPVLIIWLFCAVVGIFCWFNRPLWDWNSRRTTTTVLITVLLYTALATTVVNSPRLWGYYDLEIQVLDWKGHPVPGILVHTLRQAAEINLSEALYPTDVETSVRTDGEGRAVLKANLHQRMNILLNAAYNVGTRDEKYRSVDCELENATKGASPFMISWSRRGMEDGENMHFYSSKLIVPTRAPVALYLPRVGGDDSSPYPVTTDSQTR